MLGRRFRIPHRVPSDKGLVRKHTCLMDLLEMLKIFLYRCFRCHIKPIFHFYHGITFIRSQIKMKSTFETCAKNLDLFVMKYFLFDIFISIIFIIFFFFQQANIKIFVLTGDKQGTYYCICLLYTSPSPRDKRQSRMPSSA